MSAGSELVLAFHGSVAHNAMSECWRLDGLMGFRGGGQTANKQYRVRQLHVAATGQLDMLARECGRLYTQSLVWFWRIVRRGGVWLDEIQLRELAIKHGHGSDRLHSSTEQYCLAAFIDALKTWQATRRNDPKARPPWRRKWFYKIVWIQSAIRVIHENGGCVLILSNGIGADHKRNSPVKIPWDAGWGVPAKVEIGWAGNGYELRASYRSEKPKLKTADGTPEKVAAIDLGEIHPAVTAVPHVDLGRIEATIYNGRELRSKRQYRNKRLAVWSERISRTKPGSRRRKKLVKAKRKETRKLDNQIKDIEHKTTTRLVEDLDAQDVTKIVIGDVRNIRKTSKIATARNTPRTSNVKQKIHQAPMGRFRSYITYKARARGIDTTLIGEAYTSQECPRCGTRTKTSSRRHRCSRCGRVSHRDALGATNILRKYHQEQGKDPALGVVGVMATPTETQGIKYKPHMKCYRPPRRSQAA